MRLILIRHGQTDWNTMFKTQGHTDEPLNETGRAQSELLANRLKNSRIDGIYSSPLSRALETAGAIAKAHCMRVIKEPRMIERDFGDWEGETFADLKTRYPELIKLWAENPYECTPPNAESIQSVIERCESFLDMLAENHAKDDSIVIAGHSVPLRLILTKLIGMPYRRMHGIWLDNASVTIVKLNPARLMLLNDTAHLDINL